MSATSSSSSTSLCSKPKILRLHGIFHFSFSPLSPLSLPFAFLVPSFYFLYDIDFFFLLFFYSPQQSFERSRFGRQRRQWQVGPVCDLHVAREDVQDDDDLQEPEPRLGEGVVQPGGVLNGGVAGGAGVGQGPALQG